MAEAATRLKFHVVQVMAATPGKLWQHPFVNVFKLCNLPHWTDAEKMGDVQLFLDKEIGKNVYRIWGKIPAKNHIRLPQQGSQPLGLTGRFLYAMIKLVPRRIFVLHVDITGTDGTSARISISNLFRRDEATSSCLKLRYTDTTDLWTILVVDIATLAEKKLRIRYAYVKRLQLCSCMTVRSLYTSDAAYDDKTLPRDMKLTLNTVASHDIEWRWLPHAPLGTTVANGSAPLALPKSSLTNVAIRAPAPGSTQSPEGKGIILPSRGEDSKSAMVGVSVSGVDVPLVIKADASADAAKGEEESPVTKKYEAGNGAVNGGVNLLKNNVVMPDPILKLEKVIGFSGENSGTVLYSPDATVLVFPSSNTLISMDPVTGKQCFFFGHTATICAVAFSGDGRLMATGQEGKLAMIRVWDFISQQCLAILTGHASELFSLDISADGRALVGAGLDAHARQLIIIWDISTLTEGGTASVVLKYTTEYDILQIRFSPLEEDHLMTCGKDSIRMYRLKNGQLRGCSVQLGPYRHAQPDLATASGGAMSHIFTDLAFEIGYGSSNMDEKSVFVSSEAGAVFQVNYGKLCIEQVFQLHNGRINTISLSEGFCVTGADDGYVRVWPLDFTDYFLEAKHDGPVTSVTISADGLRIGVGTRTGSAGYLDITTQRYQTLVRSHSNSVLALAVDPCREQFATASIDCSIRVWDLHSGEQLYEFDAPGESPVCIAYHPTQYVLACGFSTGVVRMLEINTTTLLQEHKQHRGSICDLVFHPNGLLLVSAGSEGNLCVYDVNLNYLPVKLLATSLPARQVAVAVSPDGLLLATLGPDGKRILLFSLADFTKQGSLMTASPGVSKVKFSPDSRQLYAVTLDQQVECYDVVSSSILRQLGATHRGKCESIVLSQDGRFMLTAGHDRLVKVWDTSFRANSLRQQYQSFIGHPHNVNCVQLTPDNSYVLSAGVGGGILVWRFLPDKAPLRNTVVASELPPRKRPVRAIDAIACTEPREEATPHGQVEGTQVRQLDEVNLNDSIRASSMAVARGVEGSGSATGQLEGDELEVQSAAGADKGGEGAGKSTDVVLSHALPRKHWTQVTSGAPLPRECVPPPAGGSRLDMRLIVGIGGRAHDSLVWHSRSGLLAYVCATAVVVEDLRTRRQRHFLGHEQELSVLVANKNALLLASGSGFPESSGNAHINIWNSNTGQRLHSLHFHSHGIQAMSFSPTGTHLASVDCHTEPMLAVWDVESGQLAASERLEGPIHALCWNRAEGPHLEEWDVATAGQGRVDLWKIKSEMSGLNQVPLELPKQLRATNMTVFANGTGPGASELCLGTGDGSVWSLNFQVEGGRAEVVAAQELLSCGRGKEIRSLCIQSDRLLLGSDLALLSIWERNPSPASAARPRPSPSSATQERAAAARWMQRASSPIALDGPAVAMAFDEAGLEGVVATQEATISYISVVEGLSIPLLKGHTAPILMLADSGVASSGGDPQLLASASADGVLNVWAVPTPGGEEALTNVMRASLLECTACTAVSISPQRDVVVGGYADGSLRIYSMHQAQMLGSCRPHRSSIAGCHLDDQGTRILSASVDGVVCVIDVVSFQTLATMHHMVGHPSNLTCLTLSPAESAVAACAWPDRLEVFVTPWKTCTLSSIAQLQPLPAGRAAGTLPGIAAFPASKTGIVIFSCPAAGPAIFVFDFRHNQVVRQLHIGRQVSSMAITPNGLELALGTPDRLVRLLRLDNGSWQDYTAHCHSVDALTFCAGSHLCFSAARDVITCWAWKVEPGGGNL